MHGRHLTSTRENHAKEHQEKYVFLFASILLEAEDINNETHIDVRPVYRARLYIISVANSEFLEGQRPSEDVASYFHRLLAATFALKELDKEPPLFYFFDAYRDIVEKAIYVTWMKNLG
jgi:hypothetical protein